MINLQSRSFRDGVRAAARLLFCSLLCWLSVAQRGDAAEEAAGPRPLRTRESAHFVVHTDATLAETEDALLRMEESLQFAIRCWRNEPAQTIECYLVSRLENWPSGTLPHPLARIFVAQVGGATLDRVASDHGKNGDRVVIYASTAPGVVEHEVMHAYCSVVFGSSGPEWFREGMAEMASYRERDACGVRCPADRLAELRRAPMRAVQNVRNGGRSTRLLTDSLTAMLARRRAGEHHVALEAWTEPDARALKQARHDYLWSWALCHLLYHNPNYSERFRALGDSYLSRRRVSFEQLFSPLHREMMFEYSQFVRHAHHGYRVDLCHWDWNHRFVSADDGIDVHGLCKASRGWQPSGLSVTKDVAYTYRARGEWCCSPRSPTNADGAADGKGRLQAVIMQDYQLSNPFPLGVQGRFVAPMSGRLYFRCGDEWHELQENSGVQLVHFSRERTAPSVTAGRPNSSARRCDSRPPISVLLGSVKKHTSASSMD